MVSGIAYSKNGKLSPLKTKVKPQENPIKCNFPNLAPKKIKMETILRCGRQFSS